MRQIDFTVLEARGTGYLTIYGGSINYCVKV